MRAGEPALDQVRGGVVGEDPDGRVEGRAVLVEAEGLEGVLDFGVDGGVVEAVLAGVALPERQPGDLGDAETPDRVPDSDDLDIDITSAIRHP